MKTIHAVGVIFENNHQQILVLKRHPDKPEGGTWGLAGGKIEDGENPVDSAIREVKEEMGYPIDPSKLDFSKTHKWEYENVNVTFETFRLLVSSEKFDLTLDTNANTAYLWASPEELYQRKDLMFGLYIILESMYKFERLQT